MNKPCLAHKFLSGFSDYPDNIAVRIRNKEISYHELYRLACGISGTAGPHITKEPKLAGLLGAESNEAFAGLLGILFAGAGYVPLNPRFPASRIAQMINSAGLSLIVVDKFGEKILPELLSCIEYPLTILFPDQSREAIADLNRTFTKCDFLTKDNLNFVEPSEGALGSGDDLAYLMFTSGSTGKPKGVMISNYNICSFFESIDMIYGFESTDRFSHVFDLTFDLSLFDLFACWGSGATLCVIPSTARTMPGPFIKKYGLTVWFSVPSTASIMKRLGLLKPDLYPSLRYSLFCGEGLPVELARDWQIAAPNSTVDNHYGPTELTVACSWRRLGDNPDTSAFVNGLVPIGKPYPSVEVFMLDDKLEPVPEGVPGELCVRGSQTSPGYWGDTVKTEQSFVELSCFNGDDNRWYRTNDLVVRNKAGELCFIGRTDSQVQVMGFRVELGEIESVLRTHGKTDFAVALPIVASDNNATGIIACVSQSRSTDDELIHFCKKDLPNYMVPKKIHFIDKMPLNPNGKIDRSKVQQLVKELDYLERE